MKTVEGIIELLPPTFGTNQNEELARNVDILKTLLKEGEIVEEDEGSYTIRSEHQVDVGMEVTESVEVRIPKALYDVLKG